MNKIPGKLKVSKARTVGGQKYGYGSLLLRQGIDSEYPVPYVHKVGSVGRTSLLDSLGFTTGGSPAHYTDNRGFTDELGMVVRGEVIAIDPAYWEDNADISEYVGSAQAYSLNGDTVTVQYIPWSGGESVTKRIPAAACILCTCKDDFVSWCEAVIGDRSEAEMLWEEYNEGTGTVGGADPFLEL